MLTKNNVQKIYISNDELNIPFPSQQSARETGMVSPLGLSPLASTSAHNEGLIPFDSAPYKIISDNTGNILQIIDNNSNVILSNIEPYGYPKYKGNFVPSKEIKTCIHDILIKHVNKNLISDFSVGTCADFSVGTCTDFSNQTGAEKKYIILNVQKKSKKGGLENTTHKHMLSDYFQLKNIILIKQVITYIIILLILLII